MEQEYTDFYLNYVDLCAKVGKSCSAVAEELGLSRTAPNGWKKKKIPSDTTKAKIANYFGISQEELMARKKPSVPEDKGPFQLEPWEIEALTFLRSLSEGQRKVALAVAEEAAKSLEKFSYLLSENEPEQK